MDVSSILAKYDLNKLTIGVLGGHSALDVCRGAKKYGFQTLVVAQRGREKTYQKYYKSRGEHSEKGIVDHVIAVEKFSDIIHDNIQTQLRAMNTLFVHSRYFWVYCNFADIEQKFHVPIIGNRELLRAEERSIDKNQYYILQKAGIRFPKIFQPSAIDRLVIVKVNEAARGYERAFFFAASVADYEKKAKELIASGTVTADALQKATIEEYIIGAHVNFNYFYSPLTSEVELLGTDMRRQTNIDGILRLPANEQLELLKKIQPKFVETGHVAVTIKESLLEKAFEIAERFVQATKQESSPGIIGPFALQGAVVAENSKEDIVIFDCSLRIPGSPGTMFTPYSGYLYREQMSYGERIAKEISDAVKLNKLGLLCT